MTISDDDCLRTELEVWKQTVNAQMHFNDLCIRTRWLALTVLATLLTAAAIAVAQFPDLKVGVLGTYFHISIAVEIIAVIVALTLYFLDYLYYYKMLIATVEYGEELESKTKFLKAFFAKDKGLAQYITSQIDRNAARRITQGLYFGILIVIVVFFFYSVSI